MKTYVIGDLQGCHEQTLLLLERIRAHPSRFATPTLLFTADARLETKLTGLAIGADLCECDLPSRCAHRVPNWEWGSCD